MFAFRASEQNFTVYSWLGNIAATRATKPVRPAQMEEVFPAGFLCREHRFEFHYVAGIFFYHKEILDLVVV
jgi:hypothetical protein